MSQSASDQMTVYYDRSCPICRSEVETLHKDAEAWDLRDCSIEGFQDADANSAGVTATDMMNAMHVRDANGQWHTGVDAIAQLYETSGRPRVAALLRRPGLRPFLNACYAWFAPNRRWLAAIGVHGVLKVVLTISRPKKRGQTTF